MLQGTTYKAKAQCSPCLTNNLSLNTGNKFEANGMYSAGDDDQYWQLTSGPSGTGPYPRCAISLYASVNNVNASSRISLDASGEALGNKDMSPNAPSCSYDEPAYFFVRKFCVNTSTVPIVNGQLVIEGFFNDLNVTSIDLTGPPGFAPINISTLCWPNGPWHTAQLPVNCQFITGEYSLAFKLLNDKDYVGTWPSGGWNGKTGMCLEVAAHVECATQSIFVDNNHYGKSDKCSPLPVYPTPIVQPKVTGHCIQPPAFSGQITVTNFDPNPNYVYTAFDGTNTTTIPSSGLLAGQFTGQVNTTYTVTVTDNFGCALSTTFQTTSQIPHLTVTPALTCLNTNSLSTLNLNINGGTPPYQTVEFNSPSLSVPNPALFGPGDYNFLTVDANNCISNFSFVTINYLSPIQAIAKSPTICFGECTDLDLLATPTTIPPTIQSIVWTPGNLSGQLVNVCPTSTTTYTCTVTSTNGCTTTSTVNVTVNPLPVVTINVDNEPCTKTFTATSSNTPSSFLLNGTSIPLNTFTGNLTYPTTSTVYTVTAIDAKGCVGTETILYNQNPFCCGPSNTFQPQQFLNPLAKTFSSNPLFGGNGTATDIIGYYSGNIITTSDPIYFDGNIFIDQDITFQSCPNIIFTPDSRFVLTGSANLVIDDCNLRAECDVMWDGIMAPNPSNSLTIMNSTFSNMKNGIQPQGGARIRCVGNTFTNNNIGITITSPPSGYNVANASCNINGNRFTCDGNFLFTPYYQEQRGSNGILIKGGREAEIGELNSGMSNEFKNLYNGIEIRSDLSGSNLNYKLYNNYFSNIRMEPTLTGNTVSNTTILNSWNSTSATASRGAAIYCTKLPFMGNPNLFVDYDLGSSTAIDNCNKAVVGRFTEGNISNTVVDNTLMGFLFDRCDGNKYQIIDNTLGVNDPSNLMIGVLINGTPGGGKVEHNTIFLHDQPVGQSYPIGIAFNNVINTAGDLLIDNNRININAAAGAGINLFNTSGGAIISNNVLWIYPLTYMPLGNPISAGINANGCDGTQFVKNILKGHPSLLSNPNFFEGMRVSRSRNCRFECNNFQRTIYGLQVVGNCDIGTLDKFQGNHFNFHGNSIHTEDLGPSLGSLGQVGDNSYNPNNTFNFGGMATSPNNFVIFRNSNGSIPDNFHSSTLLQSNSGPNAIFRYSILGINNPNPTTFYCPVNLMPDGSVGDENFDLDLALDIANETLIYPQYGNVLKWMDEQTLYKQLWKDSSLRQMDMELQNFYNDKLNTPIDAVVRTNEVIAKLGDTTLIADTLNVVELYTQFQQHNNQLQFGNEVERQEYFVNDIYLKLLQDGLDELTEKDIEDLVSLANSCPFVNGTAVYKARALYASIDPLMNYNELDLCSEGVFKNGNNRTAIEIDPSQLQLINEDNFSIYPNPASTQVTLDYNLKTGDRGKLILYDVTGRVILDLNISDEANKLVINVSSFPKGVYMYKYTVNNNTSRSGKLIIQ